MEKTKQWEMGTLNGRLTHTNPLGRMHCIMHNAQYIDAYCTGIVNCMYIMYVCTHLPLLIVDAGEVPVNYGVVGAETEGAEVGSYRPVEYTSLF